MVRTNVFRRHSALVFSSDFNYRSYMKRPVGRPPIGNIPQLSIRMEREALAQAKERAKSEGLAVGRWIEAAIREKLERNGGTDER